MLASIQIRQAMQPAVKNWQDHWQHRKRSYSLVRRLQAIVRVSMDRVAARVLLRFAKNMKSSKERMWRARCAELLAEVISCRNKGVLLHHEATPSWSKGLGEVKRSVREEMWKTEQNQLKAERDRRQASWNITQTLLILTLLALGYP